jgi:ferritin-like metal-binding protein YciE
MASIDSLQTLLIEQLRDLYDAERRLTKAIPKLAKKVTHDELRMALDNHLAETQEQVSRLEQAFDLLDQSPKAKACAGMRGIIEEGDEHAGASYDDDGLRDAAIIGAAQRVEHYEIAAYGTAIAHARLLGQEDVVSLLEESLDEEKAADKKLTEIAENVVNLDAASEDEDEEEREAMAPVGAKASRGMRSSAMGRGGARASASDASSRRPKRTSSGR